MMDGYSLTPISPIPCSAHDSRFVFDVLTASEKSAWTGIMELRMSCISTPEFGWCQQKEMHEDLSRAGQELNPL